MFKKTLTKPDGRALYLFSLEPISDSIVATCPQSDGNRPTPHRRWHPLRQEWVIYAPQRQNRTFLPPEDYSPLAVTERADFPTEMPQGDYQVAVFENLYPAMTLNNEQAPKLLVETRPSRGACEVVVFTKDPKTPLGKLPVTEIDLILEVIAERTLALMKVPEIQYVLAFENRGTEMGVTLHHPHGQIYAYPFIPPVQEKFLASMREFWEEHGRSLLEKLISDEKADGRRVIIETGKTIAFIPVFARYPYECWIVPKRQTRWIHEMTEDERRDFAYVLKSLLEIFDRLWSRPFPYLMTMNQAPVKGDFPFAHMFVQFTPPYRSRDRLKFLAGTELGAGIFVNDSLPEEKSQELISVQQAGMHES